MELSLDQVLNELDKDPTSSIVERIHPRTKNTPLMEAILAERSEDITHLLELKANVNVKHKCGDSAIHMACKKEKVNLIKELLRYGSDINDRNRNHLTPLMYAIMNHEAFVPTILEVGGSVYKRDALGNTPLMLAVKHNVSSCIAPLLRYGADPYAKEYSGYSGDTAFEKAIEHNHVECLRILIERTNIRYQPLIHTLCELAIHHQCTDCLEEILVHGIFHHKKKEESTLNMLVFYAIEKKYLAGVRLLFKYGASPHALDWNHRTPIVWGAIHQNKSLIDVCLIYGATIDPSHYSLLHLLCIHGNTELVRYVISKGANINRMYRGNTALMEAARHGHYNLIHLLIQFGADVTPTDSSGRTARDIALLNYKVSCHQVLHDAQRLATLPDTHDMLNEMFHITLPHETWVSALSKNARIISCAMLHDCYVDEIACFVALFEGEDRVLNAFRKGQIIQFSESWIRGLCRPLGNRMYRRNLVSYLVHPRSVRHLFRQLTSAFSA